MVAHLVGKELKGYQVLRLLGRGAMAQVYLAEQKSLCRPVALKILNEELATDPAYVQRFKQEARAAAALVHPGIVQIYEVGEERGRHFIAQEYVPGENLGETIRRQGRIEPGKALDILRQVAAALHKAAELGIVHRDIKPENIMLAPTGEVKVADFGLARAVNNPEGTSLTQAGVTMGTPLYMSPEQIEGHAVDGRSDIYSLGVTAYHMLSGVPPFLGDSPLSVAVQHLNQQPEPLQKRVADLPANFAALVHRMMDKPVASRIQSPALLTAELRELAAEDPGKGWGNGPDMWSTADFAVKSPGNRAATQRLSELMKASAEMSSPLFRPRNIMAAVIACLMVGSLLAVLTREPYLLNKLPVGTPRRDSVLAQIYDAKFVDTEPAWQAVLEYFPTADPYYLNLAKQGLVRCYFFNSRQFDKAVPILEELLAASNGDSSSRWRGFAIAGLVIAHTELDQRELAARAKEQLTGPLRDQLEQTDPRVFDLLLNTLRPPAEPGNARTDAASENTG